MYKLTPRYSWTSNFSFLIFEFFFNSSWRVTNLFIVSAPSLLITLGIRVFNNRKFLKTRVEFFFLDKDKEKENGFEQKDLT